MAIRKTKTIKFGEFMSGEYQSKQKAKSKRNKAVADVAIKSVAVATAVKLAIPVAALVIPAAMLTKSMPAMAATTANGAVVEVSGHISDAVKSKIIHAFDPLVDLMVSLSLPIAGVMITGGALMIMIGMREKGYNLILSSSLGYILVQLSPMFIDLLVGVGKAV